MAKIAIAESKNGTRTSSAPASSLNVQAQIEKLAYQFFVDRGYQHGFADEDWIRAEAIVKNKKK